MVDTKKILREMASKVIDKIVLNDWLFMLGTTSENFPQIFDLLQGKILDVGCGLGDLVRQLVEQGYDAHGIDRCYGEFAVKGIPDLWKYSTVKHRLKESGDKPMPFPDNTFSIVTSCGIVDCGNPNYNEWVRVLQPSGVIYMLDLGIKDKFGVPERILRPIYKDDGILLVQKV